MPPNLKATEEEILACLPATAKEIARKLGVCEPTARDRLHALRARGKAHIGAYKRVSVSSYATVWASGPGDDAEPKQTLAGENTFGDTSVRAAKLLREKGPLSCAELCQALGVGQSVMNRALHRLRSKPRNDPDRVYIKAHETVKGWTAVRAVYALGARPDAKRITKEQLAQQEERKRHLRMITTTNFVFHLGNAHRKAA